MITISADEVDEALDWTSLLADMRAAHRENERPEIGDLLLARHGNSLLVRGTIYGGVGIGLKAVTVYPGNPASDKPKPTVQGVFLLFSDGDGSLLAAIDGRAITPWKTAADSALGASILALAEVTTITMIGAGAMARPLIEAHMAARPSIERICLWNRTRANAERLASRLSDIPVRIEVMDRLDEAVSSAGIMCSATLSAEPLIRGEWLRPGVHVDLVGAFRPDMREADDETLRRGRLFVDCRETTIGHIGEIDIPLKAGVIQASDIEGDLFDLCKHVSVSRADRDITIFKNSGGAHLDLMTAMLVYRRCKQVR